MTHEPHPWMNQRQCQMRQIMRLVSDLRRGCPVALQDKGKKAFVFVAAEPSCQSVLTWMRQFGQRENRLIMPHIRACDLGLLSPDSSADFSGFFLPDSLNALMIQLLVNPLQSLDGDDISFEIRSACSLIQRQYVYDGKDSCLSDLEKCAIGLLKKARLLPALIGRQMDDEQVQKLVHGGYLLTACVHQTFFDSSIQKDANLLTRVSQATIPLKGVEKARLIAFRPLDGDKEHFALIVGDPDFRKPVLTRLHSECFTGDLIDSLRCDCGDQLRGAIDFMAQDSQGGVLLYLRQEGRGIGLVNKLRAYTLQDRGFDTLDANEQLGYGADERIYEPAIAMLKDLGVKQIRLLTNNPHKIQSIQTSQINIVERVAHHFPSNGHNDRYLKTKSDRAGHLFKSGKT